MCSVDSSLLFIPRALVTEPEPLQHQLETWGFSLRCNTVFCYISGRGLSSLPYLLGTQQLVPLCRS